MFKVLFLMLLLLAGILGAPYIAGKQGYVLIETANYRYELSITMLVILFVASLAAVYIIEWVLSRFFRLSRSSYTWFSRRKRSKAQRQTLEGLMAFGEGNYRKAQRLIGSNAMYSDEPVLNLIKAAQAAQKAGDDLSANRYLKEATGITGENNLLVEIARIKILIAQQKWEEARSTVEGLLKISHNNPEILSLAIEIYQHDHAYVALDRILDQVERSGMYDSKTYDALEQEVENGLLDEKLKEGGVKGLLAWWKDQSRQRRGRYEMKVGMAKRLLDNGDQENAYNLILDAAKTTESEGKALYQTLQQQIIRLKDIESSKLQRVLEKQLPHANTFKDDLHRSLAYLYVRTGDYAKASHMFSELLKDKAEMQENDVAMAVFAFEQNGEPQLARQLREDNLKNMVPANAASNVKELKHI